MLAPIIEYLDNNKIQYFYDDEPEEPLIQIPLDNKDIILIGNDSIFLYIDNKRLTELIKIEHIDKYNLLRIYDNDFNNFIYMPKQSLYLETHITQYKTIIDFYGMLKYKAPYGC